MKTKLRKALLFYPKATNRHDRISYFLSHTTYTPYPLSFSLSTLSMPLFLYSQVSPSLSQSILSLSLLFPLKHPILFSFSLSQSILSLSLFSFSITIYHITLSITLYQLILSLSSFTLNSLHSSLSVPPFLARFLSLSLYILFHVTDGNMFKRREGNGKVWERERKIKNMQRDRNDREREGERDMEGIVGGKFSETA